MHTLPLRHPLDDTGLPHHPAPASLRPITVAAEPPTVTAPAAAAGFHHPHFQSVTPSGSGFVFRFVPFTGAEDRPRTPAGAWRELSQEDSDVLDCEYEAAAVLWAQARLRRQIAPLLPRAADLWTAWAAARTRLTQTFDQFWRTTDGVWRAQLLRLTDAEVVVRAAAEAWDTVAEELAQAVADQRAVTGWEDELLLTTAAGDRGYDVTDWAIEPVSQYSHPLPRYDVVISGERRWGRATPLVAVTEQLIESQRERLREVAALAGDTDRGPVG